MNLPNKTKVGIIIDEGPVPYNIWNLINMSLNQSNYQVTTIFIQKNINNKNKISKIIHYMKHRGVKRLFRSAMFSLIKKFESILLKRYKKVNDVFISKDINDFDIEKIDIYPSVSKSGFIYQFNQTECSKIKERNIDVLIRGGSGIIKGDILNICPYGILSFHHADNDINRGGPPGFWEVYLQNDYTGFIIQKLSAELDGGEVLFKGRIQTSFFYVLNWARIYKKSIIFLHNLLIDIAEGNQINHISKTQYDYPLYTVPNIFIQIKYFLRTLYIISAKTIKKFLFVRNMWGVAFQFADNWDDIVLRKSTKIKNPKYRFLADPIVQIHDKRNIIFVEDFNFKKNKGLISAIEVFPKNKYNFLGPVLEENFHLSYPYVFKVKDEIYMCPESNQSNDIRLYKCENFPDKWNLHKIIMNDVSASDSNIFYHDDKWWLFTNICSSNIGDHCSELHIFYSDSFDSSNWKKHPMNPVVFDSRFARNGGKILSKDKKLYRVFQKQAFEIYGASYGIAEICNLDLLSYKEKILFETTANYFRKSIGTHTFSFDENVATHDFLKKQFSL